MGSALKIFVVFVPELSDEDSRQEYLLGFPGEEVFFQ
jgi:hypothetical protein